MRRRASIAHLDERRVSSASAEGEVTLHQLGYWVLDVSRGRVLYGAESVALRPKAFELLAYLFQNPGRIVTRAELFEAAWPDVTVCDITLGTTIHALRAALSRDPQLRLRTVHGRGFVLEVVDSPSRMTAHADRTDAPAHTFAGREALLAEIDRAFVAARSGFGQVFLLVGEAGIGKSRVLLEAAQRARTQGLDPHLAGARAEAGAPPGWPWVELLRSLLARCPEERREALELRYPAAFDLMPEFASSSSRGDSARNGVRAASGRFLQFDALAALVRERAQEQPLVLMLDDLHHADELSIQMLQHVIGSIAGAPLVLIGAARDDARARDHAFDCLLAELDELARVVRLGGLEAHEVGELAEGLIGHELKLDVALALHARTGGNPVYAMKIVLALAAQHALDDASLLDEVAPPAVLRMEYARLAQLGSEIVAVLERAAALGSSFDVNALCPRLADRRPAAALREALERGVLVRDGHSERLRFARGVTHEVLLRRVEASS